MKDAFKVEQYRKIVSEEERKLNKAHWISFFRMNMHRYIEDFYGIPLYPHQRLEFFAMGISENYVEIASRGTAKTWKAGLFACAWCDLYPKSEVIIVSTTKKQAGIAIEEKIRPLYDKYENLHRAIKEIVTNSNDYRVLFRNGSTITVVPLTESARGGRGTLIIKEEGRLINKMKYDKLISPYKHPRQCPFLSNPKYAYLVEEPRTITISSSGRSTETWYADVVDVENQMLSGSNDFVIYMDFIIGLKYHMHTVKQLASERRKMDKETFAIEYENELMVENMDGFFQRSLIDSCRTLKTAYYPQHESRYDGGKNKLSVPKVDGEKILMSIDIALKAGKNNDNTIIDIDRLIPTKNGYQSNFVYAETMNGQNSLDVVLRIKQLWYDFNVSLIVLDCNNAGGAIYDIMTEKTIDDIRGTEYPPMTAMFHSSISKYDDYHARTRAIDALPIIYPMWATRQMNSEMAYLLRASMRDGTIKMLTFPNEGEEFLIEHATYFDVKTDMGLLPWFMRPYYQASATQGEMCALKATFSGNEVTLEEPSNGLKDRYVAKAYAVWVTNKVLNPTIVIETKAIDYTEAVIVSQTPQRQSMFSENRCGEGSRINRGGGLFGR